MYCRKKGKWIHYVKVTGISGQVWVNVDAYVCSNILCISIHPKLKVFNTLITRNRTGVKPDSQQQNILTDAR